MLAVLKEMKCGLENICEKKNTKNYICVQSCPTLCDPMDCIAHQAPLSMEFSRQEYWSVLTLPTPGKNSKIIIEYLEKNQIEF